MGTENMKICIVSFTKKGYELSCDIAYKLKKSAYDVEVFTKCSRLSDENIKNSTDENYRNITYISQNILDWTAALLKKISGSEMNILLSLLCRQSNRSLPDTELILVISK